MKVKFTLLFLTALSLSVASFHNNTFSYEPQNDQAIQKFVSLKNHSSRKILFLSDKILWSVDQYAGTITALDSDTLVPLWFSSGIVYRVPNIAQHSTSSHNQNFPFPLFGDKIEFTEICGRVYFHLSEVNIVDIISDNNQSSSPNYTDQIVAIDPSTQGKLIWKLNANELGSIIQASSNTRPRFVTTPLKAKDNLLRLFFLMDNQIVCLTIDSTSGVPVYE